jgi:DnaK suppressor protein
MPSRATRKEADIPDAEAKAKAKANKNAPAAKAGAAASKAAAKAAPVAAGELTEAMVRAMPEDEYMNEVQTAFFRARLLEMRQEVLSREVDAKERLHQREVFADPADRATAEEEHWLDLRLRERESLLLRKIDEALKRIADREYGYCEKTGDPIGIPRLLARPTATVCVDIKGQDERVEAQYRDR